MIKDHIQKRKFYRTQHVIFAGGEGIIKSFKFDSGTWVYLVEMPLGIKSIFGRVGAETMVFLDQIEIHTE